VFDLKTAAMPISKDIARAWSDVLMRTAQSWVFNCDGGCFASICEREAWVVGDVLVIYQPHKSMKEYDDLIATVMIKAKDKSPITASQLRAAKLQDVNRAMLASYNDVLDATGGKWTHAIDGTLEQLVQMRKPLHLDDGTLKMTFEIRGATNGCCGDRWLPARLAQWRGEAFEDDPDAEESFRRRCTENAERATV
jgi:hypothetical protein